MDYQSGDTASQLVLDNRKLIIGFVLLILICGSFFVIGFMEGKRQGLQHAPTQQAGYGAIQPSSTAEPAAQHDMEPQPTVKPDKIAGEEVDWYKNVNRKSEEPVPGLKAPPQAQHGVVPRAGPTRPGSAPPHASPPKEPTVKSASPAIELGKVIYSVQVGAFRYRKEAETKAALLKEKRYRFVIEPSGGPDSLFLLKVGRYDSRADAVAMQLRLKKDGFTTIIKSSK